jgi:hypothetical protein
MSYSRWSTSVWYTFWAATTDLSYKWPTNELKRSQVFEICDMPSFRLTYGELQDKGMTSILEEINTFYNKDHSGNIFAGFVDGVSTYEPMNYVAKEPNILEMLELTEYIRRWEADVDDHFKFINFIKYEWYYPLKNKCYEKNKAKRR